MEYGSNLSHYMYLCNKSKKMDKENHQNLIFYHNKAIDTGQIISTEYVNETVEYRFKYDIFCIKNIIT